MSLLLRRRSKKHARTASAATPATDAPAIIPAIAAVESPFLTWSPPSPTAADVVAPALVPVLEADVVAVAVVVGLEAAARNCCSEILSGVFESEQAVFMVS